MPDGAHVLAPVGTAPGLVVPPGESFSQGPPVVVLPGPPGELQPMWADAVVDDLVLAAIGDAEELRHRPSDCGGRPVSSWPPGSASSRPRTATWPRPGSKVTLCLRDGELEIVTRYPPDSSRYRRWPSTCTQCSASTVFSDDQGSIDEVVASLLREAGATITTAESCTARFLAGRLADVPGSSDYLLGGFVTYANQAKVDVVASPQHLLEWVGAISAEVAEAMAAGARARLGTTIGISVTGVAGPGDGAAEKPVRLGATSTWSLTPVTYVPSG